jgi:hypothetical protein
VFLCGQQLDGFQPRHEAHGCRLKARMHRAAKRRQFQQTLDRQLEN